MNSKNQLQEELHRRGIKDAPIYETDQSDDLKFTSVVYFNGEQYSSTATFSKKKDAEKDAARVALNALNDQTVSKYYAWDPIPVKPSQIYDLQSELAACIPPFSAEIYSFVDLESFPAAPEFFERFNSEHFVVFYGTDNPFPQKWVSGGNFHFIFKDSVSSDWLNVFMITHCTDVLTRVRKSVFVNLMGSSAFVSYGASAINTLFPFMKVEHLSPSTPKHHSSQNTPDHAGSTGHAFSSGEEFITSCQIPAHHGTTQY